MKTIRLTLTENEVLTIQRILSLYSTLRESWDIHLPLSTSPAKVEELSVKIDFASTKFFKKGR